MNSTKVIDPAVGRQLRSFENNTYDKFAGQVGNAILMHLTVRMDIPITLALLPLQNGIMSAVKDNMKELQ